MSLEKIFFLPKKNSSSQCIACAKAVATKVVNDTIRVLKKNSRATDKKKISVLTRLGKYAKSSAYRGALVAAIVAQYTLIVAAFSVAVTATSNVMSTYGLKSMQAYSDKELVRAYAFAVVHIMALYAMFASFVMGISFALEGISSVATALQKKK